MTNKTRNEQVREWLKKGETNTFVPDGFDPPPLPIPVDPDLQRDIDQITSTPKPPKKPTIN